MPTELQARTMTLLKSAPAWFDSFCMLPNGPIQWETWMTTFAPLATASLQTS